MLWWLPTGELGWTRTKKRRENQYYKYETIGMPKREPESPFSSHFLASCFGPFRHLQNHLHRPPALHIAGRVQKKKGAGWARREDISHRAYTFLPKRCTNTHTQVYACAHKSINSFSLLRQTHLHFLISKHLCTSTRNPPFTNSHSQPDKKNKEQK